MVKPKKFLRRLPNGNIPAAKPTGVLKKGKLGQLSKSQQQQQQTRPAEPIDPFDRILLVGEGDFSFAASLVQHYGCATVTATAFDSEEEVLAKFPTAPAALRVLAEAEQTVIYGIDATKLEKIKSVKKRGPYDRIIFNFPHVGGKTTDVSRQVRYNQELLLSFFRGAKPLLSKGPNSNEPESRNPDSNRTTPGAVYLTLFDRAPYTTDWKVKELAKEAGLALVRSEKFDFEEFPRYSHVRTLGALEKKRAPSDEGEDRSNEHGDDNGDREENSAESDIEEHNASRGTQNRTGAGSGWRGEDRKARTFIFEPSPDKRPRAKLPPPPKQKRKGGFEDISSDED